MCQFDRTSLGCMVERMRQEPEVLLSLKGSNAHIAAVDTGAAALTDLQIVSQSSKTLSVNAAKNKKSVTVAGRSAEPISRLHATGWMSSRWATWARLLLGRQLPDALLVFVESVPPLLRRQQMRALLSVHRCRHETVASPQSEQSASALRARMCIVQSLLSTWHPVGLVIGSHLGVGHAVPRWLLTIAVRERRRTRGSECQRRQPAHIMLPSDVHSTTEK